RPTCVDAAVTNGRLERRRCPQIEGLDGLYVVMPVHEHRRCSLWCTPPFGDNYRMSLRLEHLGGQTYGARLVGKPVRRAAAVVVVFRSRADRRNAQKIKELVAKARIVRGDVGVRSHATKCAR